MFCSVYILNQERKCDSAFENEIKLFHCSSLYIIKYYLYHSNDVTEVKANPVKSVDTTQTCSHTKVTS